MNLDLYNMTPSNYNIVEILTQMSSRTGNNLYPGKYGNFELYLMGLIDINELEKRAYDIYKQARDKNYITEEEYNERIKTKEIIRSYINVIKYRNFSNKASFNMYFMGKPFKYTKKRLEQLWMNERKNNITYLNKFKESDNTYLPGIINIVYTTYNDLNKITNIIESENILLNFTEKRAYDPTKLSNLYSATEGKMNISFNHSINNTFVPVLNKQNIEIINNPNTETITYFTDSWLKNINDEFNNIMIKIYSRYVPVNNVFTSNKLIGLCQNRNKNLVYLIIDQSYYNTITSKTYSDPVGDNYVKKNLLIYILEKIFNVNKTNLFNLISAQGDSNNRFEFIYNDDQIFKTKGCIKLPNISNIINGPYLHEFYHQMFFRNRFALITEGHPIYNTDLFYWYTSENIYGDYADEVHWGFSNIRGQLGGFDDLGSKIIKPNKENNPLITTNVVTFYNEIENFILKNDIFIYDDRIKKSYKIKKYIIDKQIYIDTIFNDFNKFTFIQKYIESPNINYIKFFIVSYKTKFPRQITDEYMNTEINKYEFRLIPIPSSTY